METMVAWLAKRRGLALGLCFVLLLVGIGGLVTSAPALSAGEVEKTVTLPVERAMAGIERPPDVVSDDEQALEEVATHTREAEA